MIVFGDNYNDVSMFEAVKYSVCMENADKDVKDKATFICSSNDMNGVSDFIQNISIQDGVKPSFNMCYHNHVHGGYIL